jgi:hypothetical protein
VETWRVRAAAEVILLLNYDYLTIGFPVITVSCLALFFVYYRRVTLPLAGTTEWIDRIVNPPRFTMVFRHHPMERRDLLPVTIITLVCAFLGFFKLGDMTAPQSFFRFTDEQRFLVVELNDETAIGKIMYYTGLWTGSYTLELSPNGMDWIAQNPNKALNHEHAMDQTHADLT